MNSVQCRALRTTEAEMYELGYPYSAWVVRKDLWGLAPVCSLTYFREKPTPEDLGAIYGERVLHIAQAAPVCPANDPALPLDREVLASAAD